MPNIIKNATIYSKYTLLFVVILPKIFNMLVKTFGSAVHGINATTVTVEVHIGQGINFYMVGLPDSAVKESHQRIDAALKNNGLKNICLSQLLA